MTSRGRFFCLVVYKTNLGQGTAELNKSGPAYLLTLHFACHDERLQR